MSLAARLILLAGIFLAVGMMVWPRSSSVKTIAEPDIHLGRAVGDFTLSDHQGKLHSLSDLADKTIVVIVFLGAECPLAHLYAPRLAEMWCTYGPRGVAFLAINSNAQDSLGDIAAFARAQRLPFPMLKDRDHAAADSLAATRTPEAFVLDAQRVVRYWGRIDDQYAVGIHGGQPKNRDLANAIDDLLAGRPVARPAVASVGCRIGRAPRGTPTGDLTYSGHIRPLLEKHCVECHRTGEIAPFSLAEYKDATAWSAMIREVVAEGRMPPWFANPEFGHFKNDARMSAEERRILTAWIDNHCPEGDSVEPSTRFVPGWRIPNPDQLVFMADAPHAVSNEGEIDYEYFLVDPGFTEDKYIQAAEVRPGNRAIVHHALVAVVPPGDHARPDTLGALLDYAPGMPPMILPEGTALRIPAGSKFLFQMHYTPNGSPQDDRSYLGLVFADSKRVKHCVRGGAVMNQDIDIPPGARDYRLTAEHIIEEDLRLLSLSPHMHLRGKSFRFEARYPDGRREVLLDVPRYDFHWQLRYDLAEPKRLPRGARLICTAHYNNSPGNPSNPDPTRAATWGDQTSDEMLIGFFAYVPEHPHCR